MKLFEPISQESIIDEINRLCNTTNESYKNREKIARVNEGLDQYWFLASQSAPQGTFDDTSNASIPLETQNLVSGTNQYKMTDFTNKVLQIVRVSVLDSDGKEFDLRYIDFEDTQDFIDDFDTTNTGTPYAWTKVGDYIFIKSTPDYNSTDGLKVYVSRELSKFQYVTCTITEANPGVVTATAHGLVNSDAILLITDNALPTNLTAEKTIYYVTKVDADTFKLSTTPSDVGSSYVDTSGSTMAGTHKFIKVSGEPGIPLIHHDYLARYASSKFMKTNHPNFTKTREDLATDTKDIEDYWQTMVKTGKTIIETRRRVYK